MSVVSTPNDWLRRVRVWFAADGVAGRQHAAVDQPGVDPVRVCGQEVPALLRDERPLRLGDAVPAQRAAPSPGTSGPAVTAARRSRGRPGERSRCPAPRRRPQAPPPPRDTTAPRDASAARDAAGPAVARRRPVRWTLRRRLPPRAATDRGSRLEDVHAQPRSGEHQGRVTVPPIRHGLLRRAARPRRGRRPPRWTSSLRWPAP